MSLYSSSKHKTRSNSKSSLGHLKLSVYEEDSCIVVEVHEARCLAKKDNNTSETYVKLYMLPDPNKVTKQKTRMCKGRNPAYNEKFNFLLESGDETKQLFVSVWVHDRASRNELIGCMSFKVEDILQSERLQGWYQLLDHDKGLSENVKVPSLRTSNTQIQSSTAAVSNHGSSLAVTLARGTSGYGFSVHSSTPAYVTAVTPGLPAHAADVRVNDVIIELEGIDVRHASGKQLVNMIRRCPTTLSMILLRCGNNASLSRSQSIGNVMDSFMSSLSVSPLSFSSGQLDAPRVNSRRRLSNVEQISDRYSGSNLSLSMPASRLDYRRHSASPEPLIQRLSSFSSDEKVKSGGGSGEGYSAQFVEEEEPAASLNYLPKPFAKINGGHYSSQEHQQHQQYDHQRFLSLSTLATHSSSQQSSNSLHQHHHSTDNIDGNKLTFKGKGTRKISTENNNLFAHNSNVQLLSTKKLPSLDKGMDVRWEDLTCQEKRHQKAITELFAYEINYCATLRIGIQKYKEPIMSDGLLPAAQIQKIFINIDELYDISAGICAMLNHRQRPYIDDAPLSYHVHTFADVYKLKLLHLRQNYEVYQKYYAAASQELSLSLVKPEMSHFLFNITKDPHMPTLYHILVQANEYLTELLKCLIAVNRHMSLQSEDCRPVTQLITSLLEWCPDKQLVNEYRRQQDNMNSLKLRIGFSSAVKPVVVVTPGRTFEKEGEMILVEKRKKRKVWLLLFNDLLLITRKDGKIFTVQEEPILLDDLQLSDVLGMGGELQLYVKEKEVTLKATSVAVQNEWYLKLKDLVAVLQPQGGSNHVIPAQQTSPVHASVARLNSKDDERSSPLAKMTRIKEKEEALPKGSKRKTLFNIGGRTSAQKPHKSIQRSASHNVTSSSSSQHVVDQKLSTFDRVSPKIVQTWSTSFDALLKSPDGVVLFEQYLITELSEENLQFWQACNRYSNISVNGCDLATEAQAIFRQYLVEGAPKQVNIDYQTLLEISENIEHADHNIFVKAQKCVYDLMSGDSYKRFVQSEPFQRALNNSATMATT